MMQANKQHTHAQASFSALNGQPSAFAKSALVISEQTLNTGSISSTQEGQSSEQVRELQRKSDRLTHLLEVMPAGVIVLDQQGVVTQANQQAIALLGEPLEQELWRIIINRSFKPQADDGHEVSLRDGRKVKLSITPLVEEKGQLIVITDLTETRMMQSRISHLQRLSSLGKMVASLAHQVRTPLSSAMLYAANLRSLNLGNNTADRFTDRLMQRLKDLESQVNDMLLFAKSGEQQIISDISVSQLIEQSTQSIEGALSQHQVELTLDIPAQEINLVGNQTALAGALGNLLHNAIEMSAKDSCIQFCCRQEQDKLLFSVSDTGPGVDETTIQQIFEPFFTTKSQGTGLGLAVVQSVAKSHQGSVSVKNNHNGVGATFELSLPLPAHANDIQHTETAGVAS